MTSALPGPIQRYLQARIPGRSEVQGVERYLAASAASKDDLVWALLEQMKNTQLDAHDQKLVNSELRDVLREAKSTTVENNLTQLAQTGQGNSANAATGDLNMSNNISVGGNAIINIDSYLQNVTQTINASSGLKADEQEELKRLAAKLADDLKTVEKSHADETVMVLDALKKATDAASKPSGERKRSILDLTTKGLKDAAELVKDVAPSVLTTALAIGKFIVALGV